jgi:DUF4097 and DUF4098 domain-containing protein YvlB
MAGYPPPYPPPGPQQGPFNPDPRAQRQYIKDMGRAQKAAAREYVRQEAIRRAFERRQYRALRRSSIVGPLLVLAAGVVALLIGIGRVPLATFLDWYGHWWPLLLLGAGVILVAEWAFDQYMHHEGEPYVRRGIGGGAILLLIFLAIAGPLVRAVHANSGNDFWGNSFSINPDNFDEIFGEKRDSEQQIDQPFAPGTSLAIDNPHGDVTITGKSGDNRIHITDSKQLYVRSDSEADDKARRLSPSVELLGSTLSISVPSIPGATSDLSITVPDFGETTVTTNHGTVNISAMRAPVNVTTNRGDIELNSIAGPVNAHINSIGSSFAGHNITGSIALKGHAQDLNITDVSGSVSMEGEFFGGTHLERLHGPVTFHTTRTQLGLGQLDGALDISSHSEMTGSQIVGPVRLHTSSRNISLERVAGDVDIADSKGSIEVTSATLGNVTIENRDGSINLTVPEHAGFGIDAETRDGSVENDLALPSSSTHNLTSLHGRVGDGATQVILHTSHADIEVHKGLVAAPVPPAPPAPTAKPEPPAKPAKPAAPKPPTKSVDF